MRARVERDDSNPGTTPLPAGSGKDGNRRAESNLGGRSEPWPEGEFGFREEPGAGRHARSHRRARGARRRNADTGKSGLIGRLFRGLSGSLAVGLLMLTLALTGVTVWAVVQRIAGPDFVLLVGHYVTATAALALQVVADRRRDRVGNWCVLGVVVVVAATLIHWWWM